VGIGLTISEARSIKMGIDVGSITRATAVAAITLLAFLATLFVPLRVRVSLGVDFLGRTGIDGSRLRKLPARSNNPNRCLHLEWGRVKHRSLGANTIASASLAQHRRSSTLNEHDEAMSTSVRKTVFATLGAAWKESSERDDEVDREIWRHGRDRRAATRQPDRRRGERGVRRNLRVDFVLR
jgi:hypothetical protein